MRERDNREVWSVVDLSRRNRERDKTTGSFLLSTHRNTLDTAILSEEESENSPQRGRFLRSKRKPALFKMLLAAGSLLAVLYILPNSILTTF